jgi:glycosyltransferase involved in cell wall biosynthesis
MKVTISVGGRFHAFDLARQLHNRGVLHRLITSYPKFKTMEWGIPRNKIASILSNELLNRGWNKLPGPLKFGWNPSFFLHDRYDQLAAEKIPKETDLFVGWSGFSLHSLRRAKDMGALTILERGSSHMLYQTNILKKEYETFGMTPKVAHPKIITKELEEYALADYISIPSTFVKDTFIQHGISPEKLIQVPYGVDLGNFQPIPKKDRVFRIIHCGGLSLQKGVHYLLQAFYELNLKNSELWLIGGMSQEIKPFLEKYKLPNVIIKGTFPQSELFKQYSQGSVFCLNSIDEGFGMVIPQAMACGLPVICTTNTAGIDIVRDGKDGFIIPISDVESLREKLVYFYKNMERCEEMGVSARNRVKSGFSWDDYGERMLSSYRNILENRPKVALG